MISSDLHNSHPSWYFQIMSNSKLINKEGSLEKFHQRKPDIWSAIQESLTGLSFEYRSTSGHFQMTNEASQISIMPKGEKISIVKTPPMMNKAGGGSGGVNHLNLIQIKGNPAHNWQPRVEDGNKVYRPDIRGLEMNQLLLRMKQNK